MNNIADDLSNAYSDGLRDGAPKWIKTTDRLPTAEDGVIGATGEPEVLAVTKYAHGHFPDMKMVSEIREALGRKYYPYWMPLPKLPEVDA